MPTILQRSKNKSTFRIHLDECIDSVLLAHRLDVDIAHDALARKNGRGPSSTPSNNHKLRRKRREQND